MRADPYIPMSDLVVCISSCIDLVSPAIANHHLQVAYIASCLADELALSDDQKRDVVLAAALHDVGAFSLRERIDTLQFELTHTEHAELGYELLRQFPPFVRIAEIIRYHHIHWHDGAGAEHAKQPVPFESHILHIADRVAVLVDRQREVLAQVKPIRERIQSQAGRMFNPELEIVFQIVSERESFWFDLVSPALESLLLNRLRPTSVHLDTDALTGLARLLSQIIDFKSPFTATHSSGVSASAETLARIAGFSDMDSSRMRIAGYLHDLGKLAVPSEILLKPARLLEDEFNIIRRHTFYTYRTLEMIGGLGEINEWASYHHERLDGSGYPFHIPGGELTAGSRIMGVADVFTAVSEDRPYRRGMAPDEARAVLTTMADAAALDPDLVALLNDNYDEVNSARREAQKTESDEYRRIMVEGK